MLCIDSILSTTLEGTLTPFPELFKSILHCHTKSPARMLTIVRVTDKGFPQSGSLKSAYYRISAIVRKSPLWLMSRRYRH
jgi:hypothetical protein